MRKKKISKTSPSLSEGEEPFIERPHRNKKIQTPSFGGVTASAVGEVFRRWEKGFRGPGQTAPEKSVKAQNDYTLLLLFKNGEQKVFNLKPYLEIGLFKSLNNPALFSTARAEYGTVVWQNDIDFEPDTLYLESKPLD